MSTAEQIEIRREGPWEVPEGWVWVKLRHLVSLRGQKEYPNRNSQFAFVGMDDVPANALRIETKRAFKDMKSAGNKFLPSDILYGRLRPYLNKVVVTDFEGVASGEFIVMTPKKGINSHYLQLWMHARRFVNEASHDTSGDRPRIDFDKISNLDLPLPPTAEQRRIVARIDELFTEITDGETALAHACADLATWRRALLKAAVTGELTREWRERVMDESAADVVSEANAELEVAIAVGNGRRFKIAPPRADIRLPRIPTEWKWAQLGDFLRGIEAGLNVKAEGRPPDANETGIVKISAVTWGQFNEEESKALSPSAVVNERDIIGVGDFLFSRANTLELVGAPVIVKSCTKRLVLSDKVLRLRFVASMQEWIEICLKSPLGRSQIETYASGNQLSMRNISQENLVRIAIPVPPRSEINRAVQSFAVAQESGDDGSLAIGNAEKTSASLRQSILKAAFEGRLVEQDPCDEPAEKLLARLAGQTAGSRPVPRRGSRTADEEMTA